MLGGAGAGRGTKPDAALADCPLGSGGWAGTPQYLRAYLGLSGRGPGGSGRGGTPLSRIRGSLGRSRTGQMALFLGSP